MRKIFVSVSLVVFFFIITWLSWPSDEHPSLDHNPHHGIVSRIYSHQLHDSLVYPVSSVTHLGDLDTLAVRTLGKHFFIPRSENNILHFPCSNCHNEPLNIIKNKNADLGKKAHWDIKLNHAASDVMNCTTCHSENNMDVLHSVTNKAYDFNNSFKVCAQCHQEKHKDWAGGAHGKRIGGWATPVVKKTCVNCHDPHSPSFSKRLPARHNTKMIEQRNVHE